MPLPPCYHCGNKCESEEINIDDKLFCCNGCKTVYEILNQHDLCDYYDLESSPGTIPADIKGKYDYLDNELIADKLLEFNDGETAVINLFIPTIHCSSCIWVLENLDKLKWGIKKSLVNFPKKEVRVTFKIKDVSLKEIVELLASIGYEPYISLEDSTKSLKSQNRTLIYQLALAGFAFGNIMLLSFPEYFEMDEFWLNRFKPFFRILMFAFAVPVVVYSAKDYLISAYLGLRKGILNIDVPISLGILVLFFRSSYEIFSHTGQGYFDSLSGLVFFLLLGKFFQSKTYNFLSFERDYKSYFPIAITKVNRDESHESIVVNDIQKGDRLLIRNEEIIPVDAILINGNAHIDYSFVTGESDPVRKISGDKIFAGGKQTNGAIEIEALETVVQSYLTQLWSNDIFQNQYTKSIKNITDSISKYFTAIILLIALIAGIYWFKIDQSVAFQVVSAILIIACPCALALSAPFALGNMLRIFGKNKFYLKNAQVIENIARVNTLVFDKTGTLTSNRASEISYFGKELSKDELAKVKSVLKSSNHPLSRRLYTFLPNFKEQNITEFLELPGKGIEGIVSNASIKIGSSNFVEANENNTLLTEIFIKIHDEIKGKFVFKNAYRESIKETFDSISPVYKINILSGDNEGEKQFLSSLLPHDSELFFNQKPEDKLNYIKELQNYDQNVMMLGDGLNDAGALAQSNVGIAVSENINVFSPACDGILDASKFYHLPVFLKLSKLTMRIIIFSFIISFLYNIIGMYFAVSGLLSPVVAAILMPLSSITVVTFVTMATNFISKKLLL
ncbi:heavy metal translocating P-type ATPase [Namhaeicola litoreus]|uniref:Heavy metal translocating P-type ATPase n=1 Tax=Namhaeicola litoreus TaxID=1052145 RepID=A0ABW3Y3S5_9FLAO